MGIRVFSETTTEVISFVVTMSQMVLCNTAETRSTSDPQALLVYGMPSLLIDQIETHAGRNGCRLSRMSFLTIQGRILQVFPCHVEVGKGWGR